MTSGLYEVELKVRFVLHTKKPNLLFKTRYRFAHNYFVRYFQIYRVACVTKMNCSNILRWKHGGGGVRNKNYYFHSCGVQAFRKSALCLCARNAHTQMSVSCMENTCSLHVKKLTRSSF